MARWTPPGTRPTVAASVAAGVIVLHRLGSTYGSTRAERQQSLPGDDLPWWLTAGTHAVIVPADFVMARGMLRGLACRVERQELHDQPKVRARRTS
jgi:hypothetical protein